MLSSKFREVDAVVCCAPNQSVLGGVKLPVLQCDQVLIRTSVSGISTGTDKWVITGRFEWGGFTFPLVPGYQRMGIIEEVGSNVNQFSVGQTVFATGCINYADATAGWGAHTSYGISAVGEVFDATGIPTMRGAFGVSAQVGFNAASRITGGSDIPVLVIGDGIIGASGALAALANGHNVLVVGRHDDRLERLAELGLKTVNAHSFDPQSLIDFGPEAVIDTVQNRDSFDMYFRSLPATWAREVLPARANGIGQVIYSGHSPDGETSWADMAHLQKQELTVHFVSGWTRERIESTLTLMRSGKLPMEKLVDQTSANPDEIQDLFKSISAANYFGIAACIDWEATR